MSSARTVVPEHADPLPGHQDRSSSADSAAPAPLAGSASQQRAAHGEPAGCFGQQYLEERLLAFLAAADDATVARPDGPLAHVSAATAGWGCLHLRLPAAHAQLLAEVLAPRITAGGPQRTLEGIAGLRQTAGEDRWVEFTLWGGHGRLFLHLDAPPSADPRPDTGTDQLLLLDEQLDPLEDAQRRSACDSEDLEYFSQVLRGLLPGPPAADLCEHTPPPVPVVLGPTRYADRQPSAPVMDDGAASAHWRDQSDLLVQAAGPARSDWAPRRPPQPRPWAAACAGQQRIEHHLLLAIAEVLDSPVPGAGQFLEITHALAGPACLHLTMSDWFFPHVLARFLPVLQADGTLDGMPGLRQVPGGDPYRFTFAPLDWHGRIVFHLDRDRHDAWQEHEIDSDLLYRVACTAACPPAPCPRQHLTAADRPLEHLLHHQPRLHPAEAALLHAGQDPALSAAVSRQLRRSLAPLPAPAGRIDHCAVVPVKLSAPAGRPVPHPGPGPSLARPPVELPPGLFTRAGTALTTDGLAEALARQLLALLTDGTARPGDVLYELLGIAQALGGPRATANGTLILRRTAVRYGLVRNRPRHTSDPPGILPQEHSMTWEITPAAALLAPVLTAELADAPGVDEPYGGLARPRRTT
ncbi:hypothetical protein [Streptomyces sp. NPDC051572]|uniref:hypothetical protein n=1 Tax=Streptomyces sp. NPDC051572 TaxID=3155802 RepID=UPI0034507941